MFSTIQGLRTQIFLALLVFFCSHGSSWSTFVVTRGVNKVSTAVVNRIQNQSFPGQNCNFVNGRYITFSHPQSIESDDEYYAVGILSLQALSMTVDYINTLRCGIKLQGQNYSIFLETYSDKSNEEIHEAIGYEIVNQTDFMLAGYSSDLTALISGIAESNSRILVAGGSSRTAVYENRSHVFGILPPSNTFLVEAFERLSLFQPKTVAYLQEDGISSCNSVPDLSSSYGLQLVGENFLPSSPNSSQLDEAAVNMSQIDPDIMITCLYANGCAKWIKSMRSVGWSPKAQVFTVCLGAPQLESEAGTDVAFMMGTSSWDRILPPIPDAVTGWTPLDFAEKFEATTFQNATYQHTAAATALSVLVQAIERADSIDSESVQRELANGTFHTMYGITTFDENGQNSAISWLLQYDEKGQLNIVYPNPGNGSEAAEIVYPMPHWNHRDCLTSGLCETSGGNCSSDGTCNCDSVEESISFNFGALAFCKIVPVEDMNSISDPLLYIAIAMLAVQAFISACCIFWTCWYRNRPIVKASQPLFLHFISFGCIIFASSIIPTFFQGAYRYIQDPLTGGLTEVENPQTQKLDAACMAFPWLAGLGFVIVFSALFAKIQRVKKLITHAERFSRKKVEVKDVISIMVVMVSIEFAILLVWQLVSPLKWQRHVLISDEDGFPLESVGYCTSDKSIAFVIPLMAFNGCSLIYALYLCWVTRNVPSDFAEGSSITLSVISIFQIMLLAVPILVITSDNSDATFFVRSSIVFLCSSTVSILIFGPKMWKLRQPEADSNRLTVRKSRFSSNGTPNPSVIMLRASMADSSGHMNSRTPFSENSVPFALEQPFIPSNSTVAEKLNIGNEPFEPSAQNEESRSESLNDIRSQKTSPHEQAIDPAEGNVLSKDSTSEITTNAQMMNESNALVESSNSVDRLPSHDQTKQTLNDIVPRIGTEEDAINSRQENSKAGSAKNLPRDEIMEEQSNTLNSFDKFRNFDRDKNSSKPLNHDGLVSTELLKALDAIVEGTSNVGVLDDTSSRTDTMISL